MKNRCPISGAAWCSKCYENVRRRSSHAGHLLFRAPRVRTSYGRTGMAIQRKVASGNPSGPGGVVASGVFERTYPNVLEFLSLDAWSDGQRRERGTLLLIVEAGVCKACVSDRDQGRYAFVSGQDFETVLVSVELGLESDQLDWRVSKDRKGKK